MERHFVVGKPSKTGFVPNNFGTTAIGEVTGEVGSCCIVTVVYIADRLQHQRLFGCKLGVVNSKEYLREATPEEASFAEHILANNGMWMPADSETMFSFNPEMPQMNEPESDDENPEVIPNKFNIREINGIPHIRVSLPEDATKEDIAKVIKGVTDALARRGMEVKKVIRSEDPSSIEDTAAVKTCPQDQKQVDRLKKFKDAVIAQRKKCKDKSDVQESIQNAFFMIEKLLDGMLKLPEESFDEDDKADLINLVSYMTVRHARHAAEEMGEAPFFRP